MSDMSNRMAKAMEDADDHDPRFGEEVDYASLARAALEALLDPTDDMVEAGWARTNMGAGDPIPQGDERDGEGWLPGMFRAIIQAAI